MFLLFLQSSDVALVASASWSEVTRFSGSNGEYTTDYFNCSHVEWRIDWNYTPSPDFTEYTAFGAYVYPRNQDVIIASIFEMGNTTTNGTTYVYLRQGEFYLKISAINVENYVVVIEQNLESVPEFSPIFLLSLLMTGILVAMILGKKARTSPPA